MIRVAASLLATLLLTNVALAGVGDPPPRIGEIVVEGNTRTSRAVVDRVMQVQPGDPLSLDDFDGVWDRLEDCGYFAFVDLDTEERDDGTITLHVMVEEEKTSRLSPYARYDRRHKYLLGAGLTETNLGGRGETVDVQVVLTRIGRARAQWTKPWLLGSDHLELRVATQWEQGGFVYRPFDYVQGYATASLRQYVAGPFYLEAGGGFERFEQKDDYTWDEGGGAALHPAATRDNWLARGLLGVDTRDNPFYPAHGLYAAVGVEYREGPGSDSATGRGQTAVDMDVRAFLPLPGPAILALHGYARMYDSVAGNPEHYLRWGGPETVRGANYAGREGDRAYLATAEVRWPLFMMPVAITGEQVGLGLHAFTDVGDAFFDDEVGANPRALFSWGGGAHLNLLTWQLRFEAARERDGDWTFEFMDVFNF
jgi:outer membrane protein assembly factor BamA